MPAMENTSVEEQMTVLALQRKSVQTYKTNEEYLYAMKEDLAEWFNTLYGLDINVDNFFEQLETGVALCQHANNVQSFILEHISHDPSLKNGHNLKLEDACVQYRSSAQPGTFQCRDNISNFITWCRALGLQDCLLFETEDLVMRKNERSVVLCLLEVARRGAKYGMQAPMLVELEQEIDAEINAEAAGTPIPEPPPRVRKTNDHRSLHEMVRELVSRCTCPDEFPLIRISEGRYQIGDSQTNIFVRILRSHVMVRIGGGWDTLQNYLDRHDPCRCQAARAHKNAKRRVSAPAVSLSSSRSRSPDSLPTQPASKLTPGRRQSVIPKSVSTPKGNQPTNLPRLMNNVSGRERSPSTPTRSIIGKTPSREPKASKLKAISESGSPSAYKTSSQLTVPFDTPLHIQTESTSANISNSNTSDASMERGKKRSPVVTPRGRTNVQNDKCSGGSGEPEQERGRSRAPRRSPSPSGVQRSRSVEPGEVRRKINKSKMENSKPKLDKLIIKRDSEGHHSLAPPVLNGNMSNSLGRSPTDKRTRHPLTPTLTPVGLLPSKPKFLNRGETVDTATLAKELKEVTERVMSKKSLLMPDTPSDTGLRSKRSNSVSNLLQMPSDNLPEPEADAELNQKMELLFEEYLRIEQAIAERQQRDLESKMTNVNASKLTGDTRRGRDPTPARMKREQFSRQRASSESRLSRGNTPDKQVYTKANQTTNIQSKTVNHASTPRKTSSIGSQGMNNNNKGDTNKSAKTTVKKPDVRKPNVLETSIRTASSKAKQVKTENAPNSKVLDTDSIDEIVSKYKKPKESQKQDKVDSGSIPIGRTGRRGSAYEVVRNMPNTKNVMPKVNTGRETRSMTPTPRSNTSGRSTPTFNRKSPSPAGRTLSESSTQINRNTKPDSPTQTRPSSAMSLRGTSPLPERKSTRNVPHRSPSNSRPSSAMSMRSSPSKERTTPQRTPRESPTHSRPSSAMSVKSTASTPTTERPSSAMGSPKKHLNGSRKSPVKSGDGYPWRQNSIESNESEGKGRRSKSRSVTPGCSPSSPTERSFKLSTRAEPLSVPKDLQHLLPKSATLDGFDSSPEQSTTFQDRHLTTPAGSPPPSSLRATPRKDEPRPGPPTRIPLPTSANSKRYQATPMKRYDSGVDINNISPTDTNSIPDDEDSWSHRRKSAVEMHTASIFLDSSEEYY